MNIEIISKGRIKVKLESGKVFELETPSITEDYLIISQENEKLEAVGTGVSVKKLLQDPVSVGDADFIHLT